MKEYIISNYGKLMIVFVFIIISIMIYILIKEYKSQYNKHKYFTKQLIDGISLSFPIIGKEELSKYPLETYAILLAMKKNTMSFKKPPIGYNPFFKVNLKLDDKIAKAYAKYVVKHIEKIKDISGRDIKFYDIEKEIRKKEILPDFELNVEIEDNSYNSTFNAKELYKMYSMDFECLKAGKRKLCFVMNNSRGNQLLLHSKKKKYDVQVIWSKCENPLAIKDYIVNILNVEDEIIEK